MERIYLRELMQEHGIEAKEIEPILFPNHKHPNLALARVISGDGLLDEVQIQRLASFLGVTATQLYTGWEVKASKGGLTFKNKDYEAVLDLENWTTSVFHRDSMFHQFILHAPSLTLREYLSKIDTEISKTKNHENKSKI